MDFSIKLSDGSVQLVKITRAYFKTWHVWKVQFNDGKAVMLYKLGTEWMQRNEDFLEAHVLTTIGSFIDRIIFKKQIIAF
ncbi:MAG: hypothetical protein JWQ28_2225 [Pedobacter sp.]|jgi:hypothetical protein|nr:hypothetical protein [Pedobacter sp.]